MEFELRQAIEKEFKFLDGKAEKPVSGTFLGLASGKDDGEPKLLVYKILPSGKKKFLCRIYWYRLIESYSFTGNFWSTIDSEVAYLIDLPDYSPGQLYMSKTLYSAILRGCVKEDGISKEVEENNERVFARAVLEEFNKEWEKLTLW